MRKLKYYKVIYEITQVDLTEYREIAITSTYYYRTDNPEIFKTFNPFVTASTKFISAEEASPEEVLKSVVPTITSS